MPPLSKIQYSKASSKHARSISQLILRYAADKLMLIRSEEEIKKNIHLFHVAMDRETVIGCVSIYAYSNQLVEIRSLAVAEEYQGQGVGKKLLLCAVEEAKASNTMDIFSLTLEVDFFKRNGFIEIEKSLLPEKIWQDCLNCPVYEDCRETAVILRKE